jgi:ribonuclease P protein component
MPGDAPGGGRFKFSLNQRLKRAWEFERTRREGQRLVKGCLILNWRFSDDQKTSRLGVVTSKKIGNAVVRSRARRLLREVFRLHQHDLKSAADIVLIARNSIAGKSCGAVERDFLNAAKQARLLIEVSC